MKLTIGFFLKPVNENRPQISTLRNENTQNHNHEKKHSIQVITDSADEFSFSFQDTDLRIELIKGDIINQIASIIVNSANNALQLSCLF